MSKVSFVPPNGSVVTPHGHIYTEHEGRLYTVTVGDNTPPCPCNDDLLRRVENLEEASKSLRGQIFDLSYTIGRFKQYLRKV